MLVHVYRAMCPELKARPVHVYGQFELLTKQVFYMPDFSIQFVQSDTEPLK